ncbi:MAG: hypothetical protein LLG14_10485 [Nocardiaceae bacterium]|nr:hypothetical protein [Nocardiaceae bacterium]
MSIHPDSESLRVDPAGATNRIELGNKLTELREVAGLTVREVVDLSGSLHGTVAGWFAGQHVPTKASRAMFDDVLAALGVEDVVTRDSWWEAVTRARRAPGPRGERSPYKGLANYTEDDTKVFFGRADLIADALELMAPARPVFIVGASGSGKSSLIRAGIIPALPAPLRAVVIKPGDHPLSLLLNSEIDAETVLCIDQFEELWTMRRDRDDRTKYLSMLLTHPAKPRILVGLRADFYPRALDEPLLLEHLKDRCLLVGPLTSESLKDAIRRPAESAGFVVDDELVQVVLSDLAPRDSRRTHDPGALPLLSHALLSTWELSQRKQMTVAAYQATGGIKSAVERSAEQAYAEIDLAEQGIARTIFRRLVAVDGSTEARRRVGLAELFDVDTAAAVRDVVSTFVDHRLLTLTEDTVEITHEVLLSQWSRLRKWVRDGKDGLLIHRRLTIAAQLWEESRHDETTLLGPDRLKVFSDWAKDGNNRRELNNLEKAFLDASAAHRAALTVAEELRLRKSRRLNRSLGAISVFALVATVGAGTAGLYAQRENGAAEFTARQAKSVQAANAARHLRDTDPALAAQIAVAAYRLAPTVEATSALIDATAIKAPTRLTFRPGPIAVRVNRQSTQMIVGTVGGAAQVYRIDIPTPQLTGNFTPLVGGGAIDAIAYSPNGRYAAVGGATGAALWQVDQPKPRLITTVTSVQEGGGAVHRIEFSPNGEVLAIGAPDGSVQRWDIADPSTPKTLAPLPADGTTGPGRGYFAFSADGSYMASAADGNSVTLWDVSAQTPTAIAQATMPTAHSPALLAVALSNDGTKLAAGSSDGAIYRWDIRDPRQPVSVPPLTEFSSSVNDVTFSADSQRIAAVSSDQTVRIFDWADGRNVAQFPTPGNETSVQYIGPDNRSQDQQTGVPVDGRIVVGSSDGSVRIFDASPTAGAPVDDGQPRGSETRSNRIVALAGPVRYGLDLDVWDAALAANTGVMSHVNDSQLIQSTAVSHSVAIGTSPGGAMVYELTNNGHVLSQVQVATVGDRAVDQMRFSPDGLTLAVTTSGDPTVHLWSLDGHTRPVAMSSLRAGGEISGIAFRPGWKTGLFAAATADGSIRMWSRNDWGEFENPHEFFTFPAGVAALTFVGRNLFAVVDENRRTSIWDIAEPANPRKLSDFSTLGQDIRAIEASPNGALLAVAGIGEMQLWDLSTPQSPREFARLSVPGSRVASPYFYPDSATSTHKSMELRAILSSPTGWAIRSWQTNADTAIFQLCSERGTPITRDEWSTQLQGIDYFDPCA